MSIGKPRPLCSRIAITVTSLIAFSAAAGVSPNTLIKDRSKYAQYWPINYIERIDDPSKGLKSDDTLGQATGINISPCLFITNHHVVYGVRDTPFSLKVSAGTSITAPFQGFSRDSTVIQAGNYDFETGANDWVVLKSNACFGKRFGWYDTAALDTAYMSQLIKLKKTVLLVAFPGFLQGKGTNVGNLVITSGHIIGWDTVTHNIAMTAIGSPGSSGGAVFTIDGQKIKLIGLYVGGIENSDVNEFVFIGDIIRSQSLRKVISLDNDSNTIVNKVEKYLKYGPLDIPRI